jgi:hypothetical protein
MKRTVLLLVAGAMWLMSTAAYAHHSFAATYYEDQLVSIEGELVAFLYRNPHSFVHVMAPDKDGKIQRWAVEWGAISQLNRQGVERYTLKPGDKVQISGAPARNPDEHKLLMRRLVRPSDGFKWAAQVN